MIQIQLMHLANSYTQNFTSQDQENRRSRLSKDCINSQVEESYLKESTSTRRKTLQTHSSDNLYIAKIQSKALELQKKLDTQNYQIDTLSAETQHYMKICEEQKQQLARLDVEMLRQEYVDQMQELMEEKQKISQLIFNLTEEYREVQNDYEHRLDLSKTKNSELTLLVEEALAEKERLLLQIGSTDKEVAQNEETILNQQERIDQLRNVERKLFIALKEMETLQKRKN